jgi:hypothetical protein
LIAEDGLIQKASGDMEFHYRKAKVRIAIILKLRGNSEHMPIRVMLSVTGDLVLH